MIAALKPAPDPAVRAPMPPPQERVRWIVEQGVRILEIDFEGCGGAEVIEITRVAMPLLAREPRGSVLTLTLVANAQLTRDNSAAMREYTAHNRPYVRAAAVVGASGLIRVTLNTLQVVTRRNLHAFAARPEAVAYLLAHARGRAEASAPP